MVRRMAGLSVPESFFLPKNWADLLKKRSRMQKQEQTKFLSVLTALKRLCLTSQLVFDDVKRNEVSKCGVFLVKKYESCWKQNVGPVTSYAHLLANHVYSYVGKVNLNAISAENIELLNKKQRGIIESMTTNGKPLAPQILKVANMKESLSINTK